MDNKLRFKLILVLLAAIVLINLAILHLFQTKPPVHTIKPVKSISFLIDDIDNNFPNYGNFHKIIYYSNNGTWKLQEKERYNIKLDKVYYIYPNASKMYYSYSPNITIEDSNISFNFGIRNVMATEVLEVPLTIETRISKKNGEILSTEQKTIVLNNLKDLEYKEVRLTAKLVKPPENEILDEMITLGTPSEVRDLNGSIIRQNEPTPATGSAGFSIRSSNE